MDFLKEYSENIDRELRSLAIPESPSNLYDPLRYFFTIGGKRIRPILTLLAAEKFGSKNHEAMPAALAIEIFHNFSLIHDDIMDEAPVRRGKETVHKKWDTNIAILSGDVLLIKAYQQLNTYPENIVKELHTVFNKTAIEVCEGQQMDMDFENISTISRSNYLEMIKLKTSVLLGCALKIGAIIAGANQTEQQQLYDYGINMGIAFQIQDDLLDLYGDPSLVGKQVGGDIIANKNTLLMILAKEDANSDQLNRINELTKELNSEAKIQGVLTLFEQLNVKNKCAKLMNSYYDSAQGHLNNIESKSNKSALWRLTNALQHRAY